MKLHECEISDDQFKELQDPDFNPQVTPPCDQMEIPSEVLELYYKAACLYLHEKKWFEARESFIFLTFLNPSIYVYWTGLGIANQSLEKYDDALDAYLMAQSLSSENPVPYANAYQCYKARNEEELAASALDKAIALCSEKEEFAELKQALLAQRGKS